MPIALIAALLIVSCVKKEEARAEAPQPNVVQRRTTPGTRTEKRAVLHTALRARETERVVMDGVDFALSEPCTL